MLSTLKTELFVIQRRIYQCDENLEAKYSIMRESVQHHLKCSLENGVSQPELVTVLKCLCYEECLLPTKLHDWCFAKLNELCNLFKKEAEATPKQIAGTPPKEPMVPPLFCKEVVYHAALLCDVISQSNAKDYAKFLKKQSTGHYFEEISVSNPSSDDIITEKYVIAKHDKTLYVAFCGEPHLSEWKTTYESFEEGIYTCTYINQSHSTAIALIAINLHTCMHTYILPRTQAFQSGGRGEEEHLVHTVVCMCLISNQLYII